MVAPEKTFINYGNSNEIVNEFKDKARISPFKAIKSFFNRILIIFMLVITLALSIGYYLYIPANVTKHMVFTLVIIFILKLIKKW